MNRVKSTVAYREGDKTTIIFYGYLLNREQIESAINAAIHADETQIEAETEPIATQCRNCFYFDERAGQCRRNPPVYIASIGAYDRPYTATVWPEVRKDHWCGEWTKPDFSYFC